MADKSYRPWSPDQVFLLPPSMRAWLPDDHLVYFVMDVVAGLDLSSIERPLQQKDHRGERPWNPRMMVALLFYGYCLGVRSSRRLEKATYEDVAFRLLTGDTQPDHSSIAEFRKLHLAALSALFLDILRLCEKAGMVKLGRVALDGTKMKANASKRKAMSYGRMKQREADLRAEIAAMLAEAGATDAEEDALHGRDKRGDELPTELRRRQDRLKKIQEAREALEAEAKAARAAELAERERSKQIPPEDPPPPELPSHQVRHDAAGNPAEDAQRNFTDSDSRIMVSGKEFVQGYNAQAVVDEGEQVIVATGLTNQAPDAQHLPAMIAGVEENLGARPVQILADAGYYSAENAAYCERLGTDALLSVAREKHVLDVGPSPWPPGDPRAAMRANLRSVTGAAAYRRRKCIVEPVFGQIKEARGIRRFLLRGLQKARAEWNLICLTHNLLKLFRFTQRSAFAAA
jgi:transposase